MTPRIGFVTGSGWFQSPEGAYKPDRFRIKFWRYDANLKQDVIVYENQLGSTTEGTLAESTAIGGGVITIHASKN